MYEHSSGSSTTSSSHPMRLEFDDRKVRETSSKSFGFSTIATILNDLDTLLSEQILKVNKDTDSVVDCGCQHKVIHKLRP